MRFHYTPCLFLSTGHLFVNAEGSWSYSLSEQRPSEFGLPSAGLNFLKVDSPIMLAKYSMEPLTKTRVTMSDPLKNFNHENFESCIVQEQVS